MTRAGFLSSHGSQPIPGAPALLGLPLDMTCTYRSGCADGPRAVRAASDSIETYSPCFDRDLLETPFSDLGDCDVSDAPLMDALDAIAGAVREIRAAGAIPLCIGGEHTVSLPLVACLKEHHPDLVVIHADAHTDLRDHYEGSPINHATVMRRVAELLGPGSLVQLGIRSGTREEFRWMSEQGSLEPWTDGTGHGLRERIAERPVYLSFDIDVLDPSCMPGTGNPEPGGWDYHSVERLLRVLDTVRLVGADVVELSPGLDPSDVSAVTTAKIIRELILILGKPAR